MTQDIWHMAEQNCKPALGYATGPLQQCQGESNCWNNTSFENPNPKGSEPYIFKYMLSALLHKIYVLLNSKVGGRRGTPHTASHKRKAWIL